MESAPNSSPYPVRKGNRYTFEVERLAFGARGVAKVEGYTVFIDRGLPGQRVEATVYRRRKRYAEARIDRVLTPAPDQVAPRCADFGTCGGCALQHLAYPGQLKAKQEQVRDCLAHLAGLDIEVRPTVPAPEPYEYRGKMEYSFGDRCWLTEDAVQTGSPVDRFALGLHIPGRYDRILNVERCHLQSETGSAILREVRGAARRSGLVPYSTKTHRGFWRFLVIRETTLGQRMVNLITNALEPNHPGYATIDALAERLTARFDITSLLHSQTGAKANVARSESIRVLAGAAAIEESVLGCRFALGPNTFFQSNPAQAHRLFTEAVGDGAWLRGKRVWDLYCGVGAISLPLARFADHVLGLEWVEESVEAARVNARRNGLANVDFVAGDMKELLKDPQRLGPKPQVVVVDPPRDGMHPRVISALVELAPQTVVYVSCNPSTLARDLELLTAGGYVPGPAQPVDMFPHTAHIECVIRLDRG